MVLCNSPVKEHCSETAPKAACTMHCASIQGVVDPWIPRNLRFYQTLWDSFSRTTCDSTLSSALREVIKSNVDNKSWLIYAKKCLNKQDMLFASMLNVSEPAKNNPAGSFSRRMKHTCSKATSLCMHVCMHACKHVCASMDAWIQVCISGLQYIVIWNGCKDMWCICMACIHVYVPSYKISLQGQQYCCWWNQNFLLAGKGLELEQEHGKYLVDLDMSKITAFSELLDGQAKNL